MATPAYVRLMAGLALLIALGILETTNAGAVGNRPSGHLGKEFIVGCLKNHGKNKLAEFQVYITAYHAGTIASITATNPKIHKEFHMKKGETLSIPVSRRLEMKDTDVYASSVNIKSNKVISAAAQNILEDSSSMTALFPVNELGREYYVITPSSGPEDAWKEFYVIACKEATKVDMSLTAPVTFKGQNYEPGSTLTVDVKPLEIIQILCKEDLSGTKVEATKPVGIFSGHSCAGTAELCSHVSEQLLPVPHWGSTFIVPPLNKGGQNDIAYVTAAQNTNLQFQLGESLKSQDLVAGEVFQIEVPIEQPLVITANLPVQVLYYSSGGKDGDKTFSPFLTSISDTNKYSTAYKILGLPNFETNSAMLIAKSSSASEITMDKNPLPNVQWNPVPGSEFSWARLENGAGFSCHQLDHGEVQFGVLSIGYSDSRAYGSSAIGISAPGSSTPYIPTLSTQPTGHLGLEFTISFMQNNNQKGVQKYQLLITAYFPSTTVSVNVPETNFQKEFTVEEGETISVPISKQAGLTGTNTSLSSVMVKSDKVISVISQNFKDNSGGIELDLPNNKLGLVYYVVTPPEGPAGEKKEFSITNLQDKNKIEILLTAFVNFQGRNYDAGSTISVDLGPKLSLQIQSDDDLSGTIIKATGPIRVSSGHSCSGKEKECNHVSQQLRCVSEWGSRFIVPSLTHNGDKNSQLFVVASKKTRLEQQQGENKETKNLNAGDVLQIKLTGDSIYISASSPIQVLYYNPGGKVGDQTYSPFFMDVPDMSQFGTSYKILGQSNFDDNFAVFLAKTSLIPAITFDEAPLPNLEWKPISNTDYSWAQFNYGSGFSCHRVDNPDVPFGLLSYGYGDERAYASQAIRIVGPPPAKPLDLVGTYPLSYLGKEFIIAGLKNPQNTLHWLQIQMTSFYDFTQVYVNVDALNLNEVFTMQKGETKSFKIQLTDEMKEANSLGYSIRITSNNIISVVSIDANDNRMDPVRVLPVNQLGHEYYIVTRPKGSANEYNYFSVANDQTPNLLQIHLTASISFQGVPYAAGSTFTVTLEAYQSLQMQSQDDLSGTKIEGEHPFAVVSGHCLSEEGNTSYQASTQFLPVSRWGKTFLLPDYALQSTSGVVRVIAYQTTNIDYQIGGKKESKTLNTGQVIDIDIEEPSPLLFITDVPVQALYFNNGGTDEGRTVKPSLLQILDTTKFDKSYMISSDAMFQELTIYIVILTSAISELSCDASPKADMQWTAIPGSEYSCGKYNIPNSAIINSISHPRVPFAITIGQTNELSTFLSPAVPTSSIQPSGTLGKDFIIAIPHTVNQEEATRLEITITSYYQANTIIATFEKANIRREMTLGQRETGNISFDIPKELLRPLTFTFSIMITSEYDISVVLSTYRGSNVETSQSLPVHELGMEYYVVTPSIELEGYNKEFSITNQHSLNPIEIYPTAAVNFNGQDYSAGSKITITLEPSQGCYVRSKDDLTGTKICSKSAVAVVCGSSPSEENPKGQPISIQLLPVPKWGTSFIIPRMAETDHSDIVYVISPKDTDLEYQVGDVRKSQKLLAGEVARIDVNNGAIFTAALGVQIIYFSVGYDQDEKKFAPYAINVPEVSKFGTTYQIPGDINFDNHYAYFTVKTSEVPLLTFDQKPVENTKWEPISGTDYSWGKFKYDSGPDNHFATLPSYPFGVTLVSYNKDSVSSSPGTCTSALDFEQNPTAEIFTDLTGTDPLIVVGKEFIVSSPKSKDKAPTSMEIRVTARYDYTIVTISVDQIKYLKELTLDQGQTSTSKIMFPAESLIDRLSFSIRIIASNIISVITLTENDNKVKTADVFPVHMLGNEYFLVTLPDEKEVTTEFSVANKENPTEVVVYPTGNMEFEGQTYPAGSKITKTLGPFQGMVLQSNDNVCGTRIVSTHPVSLVSGSTQLLPTIHWGKTFMVPPLSSPECSGIALIVAAQPTKLRYQLGAIRHKEAMVQGQVVQVEMKRHTPLYIRADHGLQVVFYSKGEKTEGGLARPYLVNIYDITKFDTSYTVTVNDKAKKNLAILTAEAPEATKITWDGQPISAEWKTIPGSQFVVAEKDLGNEPGTHTVNCPNSAFGLQVIEFTDKETLVCPGTATSELQPSGPIGKEFIVPCPYNANSDEPTIINLKITAFFDQTTVTVILEHADFNKEITLGKGETDTVSITIPKEMLGDVAFTYSIIIQAIKEITVEWVTHRGKQVETNEALPLHELGVEYVVITPTGQPTGGLKQFSISNCHDNNTVDIELNADVVFQGQEHKKGSKLTQYLEPYQTAFIQSKDLMDGTRIAATKPVAVANGYSSPDKGTDYHVAATQFLPVSHWGLSYLVPSLAPENQHDFVVVTANTHTLVDYQVGGIHKREVLEPKDSIKIELPSQNTLAIKASNPVQAIYHSPGGEHEGRPYDGYLFKIPDVTKFGTRYTINDSPTLDKKYAFFTATTPTTSQITFDKEPVSNVDWKPISGTDYWWGKLDFSDKPGSHVVEQDQKPLGLIVVGYGDHRVSVKPAAPTSVLEFTQSPSEEPAGGTPSSPVGKEFVIPSPKIPDTREPVRFEITISVYADETTCTVQLDEINFKKDVTLMKGQTTKITISIPAELQATLMTSTILVVVNSDKLISVLSQIFVGNNVETTKVVPLQQMGTEYYVVIPPGNSADDQNEITVANFGLPTTVYVTLTCSADFQGETYNSGSTITHTLAPYKVMQIQSKDNLSGTKIVTTNAAAVSCGFSSPEKVTPTYHVATQLCPVSRWRRTFSIPSMASEGSSDIVLVVAAQPTKVKYKVGDSDENRNLEPGQVLQIEMPAYTILDLIASEGILVTYYGKGGKVGYQEYNPYFINIPDRKQESTRYLIQTSANYDSIAALTVKTSDASQVTLDGNPLLNVEWKQISDSEYSTAKTDLGHKPGNHTIEGPKHPFGVLVIARTKTNPDQLTGGEHPLNPAGTTFVIPTPVVTDTKELVRLTVSITAYRDATSVTIILSKINFEKEETLKNGQTTTIEITIPADILTGSNPIIIKSKQPITVMYSIFIGNGVETTTAVPLEQQGTVYYVVTLPGKSDDDYKVVSITNYDSPNKVDFYPTGVVEYQEQTYEPGSTIPITLEPFQGTQIQSKHDLTGSRIVGTSRFAVSSGYSSPEKVTPPYQGTTSLPSIDQWGTKFLFTSQAFPGSTDNVIVIAYKPTQLTYTVGENKQSQNLEPGQVARLKVPESSTVSINTDHRVMVVYSCTGGKIGDTSYEPFTITVPDAKHYSIKYLINGNPNYEKTTAFLTVMTQDVSQVTFDGQPLPKIEWQPISETGYSTGKFDIGNVPISHTIQGPSNPFGVMTIGYPKKNPDLLTGGEHPLNPAGTTFVIPTPVVTDTKELVRLTVSITAYRDATSVTIILNKINFEKKETLKNGQTATIEINIPADILTSSNPVIIKSEQPITVMYSIFIGNGVETTTAVPVEQQGTVYYVVTLPGKSDDDYKVVSITNYDSPNKVDFYPTGVVEYQEQTYEPGSTIPITLEPFQGTQIQSKHDLTGSRIVGTSRFAASSGYSSPEKVTPPYQGTTSLPPIDQWGTKFLFTSQAFPGSTDNVIVIAYKPTQLTYTVGENKQSQNLEPGQVARIKVPESSTVSINTDHRVMVVYSCTGGKIGDTSYEPFTITIPDAKHYSIKYLINGNPNYEKTTAFLTVMTQDVSQVTFDGRPLPKIEWQPISETGYSTGKFDIGNDPISHTIQGPNNPFGVMTIGYPKKNPDLLTGGEHPLNPAGTTFVIPTPVVTDTKELVRLTVSITAYRDATSVTIILNKINFEKKETLKNGQTATIEINIPADILTSSNPVIIKSEQPITVMYSIFIGNGVETTTAVPVEQQGTVYYVVTLPGKSDDDYKVVSITNYDSPNKVDFYPTGVVEYQEQTYEPGSTIPITLEPFQGTQIQSKHDLTGSRIVGTSRFAASSGYSSPEKVTPPYQGTTSLPPIDQWGTKFLFTSQAFPGSTDNVIVIAYKPTQLTYTVGENKQSQNLEPGQVARIKVPESSTVSINTDHRVMVVYSCTGGKIGDTSYEPFTITIPDAKHYSIKYLINGNPNYEKTTAFLTVMTQDVSQVTFDGRPLPKIEWQPISETGYSTGKFDIGNDPISHTIQGPNNPFGVMTIGYPKKNPDLLTGGEHPLNPAGTTFVIPTPVVTDTKELVRLTVSITAYRDATSVTIILNKINFEKKETLKNGQTATIEINIPADILTSSNPVIIKSEQPITVMYSIFIGNGVETTTAVPVEQQGTVYYVVTLPGKSDDDYKVVSITNYDSPNKVDFYPTGVVEYQEQTYEPGSTIPITLEPFQGTQIQSKHDLTGSRIVGTSRFAASSGYSSPEKVTPPYQGTTSLPPIDQWGTKFLFTSQAFPGSTDNVIVIAYKPTQLTYTVGENKQSQNLEPGQVARIKVPESSTVSINTDHRVMVVYSCTGGKIGDTSYEPFTITIPDAKHYSIKYLINGNPNYEKTTAFLTVMTQDVSQVTFDGRPLPKIEWQPISETGYSTGKFDIGNDPISHTIQGPNNPFGVMTIGYPKKNPDLLTGGDHPAYLAGTEFVIPTSQIPKTNEPIKYVFHITCYNDDTTVTVRLDPIKYKKEFPLKKGQTVTVTIAIPHEMLSMFKGNPPFIITATTPISFVTKFYVGSHVEVIEGVPLQKLGVKYYVVTPPGKPDDDKVFSITNFGSPNKIDNRPTGVVNFQDQIYQPGSTITTILEPYQGISIQNKEDLSGSKVVSSTPVSISSGYTSSEMAKIPYQVTSSLKPIKYSGRSNNLQSMTFPGRLDTVHIIASQPTQVEYQVGPNKESQTMESGQVVHTDIPMESSELPGGEITAAPVGKKFVIPSPKPFKPEDTVKLQFMITAEDETTVNVEFEPIKFKKELTLVKGQTATFKLTIPGVLLMGTDSKPVIITSSRQISITTGTFIGDNVETTEVLPLQKGGEYYALTPPGRTEKDNKEISFANFDSPNEVILYLTGSVQYKEQTYPKGSTITINLKPFEETHLQSKDDLTGTKVVATNSFTISSGYSSPDTSASYYRVSIPLRPDTSGGKTFMFPSLAFQGSSDTAYVTTSKPTQLEYQVGDNKQSQTLKPGEVIQIKVPDSTTLSIHADNRILVTYYCTGGKIGDKVYQPYLVNIRDKTHYGSKYFVITNPNFEKNLAILTVKTVDVPKITCDGQPIKNAEWKEITSTEYSTASYDIGNESGSHILEVPGSPFGLTMVGYTKQTAPLEPVPTPGEITAAPVGKKFVIPSPKPFKPEDTVKLQFRITAEDETTVNVEFEPIKFKKELTLVKGQTATFKLTIPGVLLMGTDTKPVIITSSRQISITTGTFIGDNVETTEVLPLQKGGEYYAVTPPGRTEKDNKEISFANFDSPNEVILYLTGSVQYKEQTYPKGSTVTINLKPFEETHLQSKDDLTGTKVVATNSFTISSGYSSPDTSTSYYRVSIPLRPDTSGGKTFMFPSLAFQGSSDTAYVTTSKPTQLEYQVGDNKQSQTLKPGEVVQIKVPDSTTLSIHADDRIMVTYYCTGGKIGDKVYQPYLVNIRDKTHYGSKYFVITNPNFEKNLAILTVKTVDVPKITCDGQPIKNAEWKEITGTEYSSARYDIGNESGSHILEVPGSPFGLTMVGYTKQTAPLEPVPTPGEITAAPVGKKFVIPSPKPFKPEDTVKLQFMITAEDETTVNVEFEPIKFKKELTLVKGQTATFKLTIPGVLLMGTDTKPVIITSSRQISITTGTFIGDYVETTEVLPLQKGGEYYAVTPSGRTKNDNKEISLANFDSPNEVILYLTGSVQYKEQTYPKGSTVTINLKPFEETHLQSKDDLTGTKVVATNTFTISSGYSSPDTSTSYYRVSIPLRPDTSGGKTFMFPSLAFQGSSDTAYVTTSKPTQLEYQVGDNKQSQTLKPGEVVQIKVPDSTTLSIHADDRILVTYYCTGGKIGDKVYQPYLVNIRDKTHYGSKYFVITNPNFEKNLAILTVKTVDVPKITCDGQPIKNAEWKEITSTEYSSASYDIGNESGSHILEVPGSPFGLTMVGYTKQTAPLEPVPTPGGTETGPPKKEFVLPGPKVVDENGPPLNLQYHITAIEGPTKVTLFYAIANFKRELILSRGQTATIGITIPRALLRRGSGTITIKADKLISVSTGSTPPKPEIHPVQQEGGEYYIVTPEGNSKDNNKEFTIINSNKPNNVEIWPTGTIEHEGITHPAGSKITLNLAPSQMVHMQSKDDLSGTRVVSTNAMVLTSGYSCSGTVSPCFHVAMQVRSISQWGETYYVPSMAFTGNTDTVFIVASITTKVEYVVGGTKHSQTLKAGEVIKTEMVEFSSVFIRSDQPIMVMYYCSGGKIGDRTYNPYLIPITDAGKFGNRYKVKGNPNVEKNVAVLTAKTSDMSKLTFDGKAMSNIQWHPIIGTEYSWGKYEVGTEPEEHILELSESLFGLMVVGYGKPILAGNKPA